MQCGAVTRRWLRCCCVTSQLPAGDLPLSCCALLVLLPAAGQQPLRHTQAAAAAAQAGEKVCPAGVDKHPRCGHHSCKHVLIRGSGLSATLLHQSHLADPVGFCVNGGYVIPVFLTMHAVLGLLLAVHVMDCCTRSVPSGAGVDRNHSSSSAVSSSCGSQCFQQSTALAHASSSWQTVYTAEKLT